MIVAEDIYYSSQYRHSEVTTLYKKILVATDGSDQSKNALEHAANSAQRWGALLTILSVVPPPTPMVLGDVQFGRDFSLDLEKTFTAYHLGVLDEAKKTLKAKYPSVPVATQLKKGTVAPRIVEASEDEDIDLIIIGSRGLSGLSCFLLGSISNYVVNHCKKPVLVVK